MDSPKPSASPPPPATTTATGNHHALDNLKSLLMKCAIASTPAKSLTLPQKTFIEKRIQDFFPTIHTPDHPPYAWMIENAIKQMNEEGGSNEEAISKFILEEYHDLPWSHAALLKHHLKQLSESGNLVEVHGGCYLIGKASITLNRTSKRTPTLMYMNSPSPSLSLSYSPSPSPSPSSSSSSSSTYESSSSSSSSHSFSVKGKGRKRNKKNHKRTWSQRRKQSARGIKIHHKYKEVRRRGRGRARGRGRGRGRGRARVSSRGCRRGRCRGRGRGWDCSYDLPCEESMMTEVHVSQAEDEVCMGSKEAMKMQYIIVENEVTDEDILGNQDSIDVEGQVDQSATVIEIEPVEQEYRVNEEIIETLQQEKVDSGDDIFIPSTIPWSCGEKLINEQGSEKVGIHERSIHSKHTPPTGSRQRRSCKREMQMRENGKTMELQGATEREAVMGEEKRKKEEQSQLQEGQCYRRSTEVCLINDENMVPEWLTCEFPPAVKVNMMEEEIGHVGQVEPHEEDKLDELIEEVYMELIEAAEIQDLMVDDESARGNIQRVEHYQVQVNHDSVSVEGEAEPSTMVIEVEPQQQDNIVSQENIGTEQQNVGGDTSPRPHATSCWKTPISMQGQEQGSKRIAVQKRSIQSKHTPHTGRRRGRPRKRGLQIEETGELMELLEATATGSLMEENKLDTGEQNQSKENLNKQIEIQDRAEGMQHHKINQQIAADQVYEINDVEPQEQEYKFTDDLNKQQIQEISFGRPPGARVVSEQYHLEGDQGSCIEEQNHAQIQLQENEGATAGLILLKEDKDESVNGLNHKTGIQDVISEKTSKHQASIRSNVDPQNGEYHVDDYLREQQLGGNEHSRNPILKEVIRKQGQQLVIGEQQKQESNLIQQQDQLKEGQAEVTEEKSISEGDCPLIEEETHIKKSFEVLETQNLQIEQPEAITEQNQPEELHCSFVYRGQKENDAFKHSDQLRELEKENNEEICHSGKTQADEHPHKQQNEDQIKQTEHITRSFSEQPVAIAEHDRPMEESERMGTETLKVEGNAENGQKVILSLEETSVSMMQNKQKNILGNMEQQNRCGDRKYVSEHHSDAISVETSTEEKSVEDSSIVVSMQKQKQTMEKPQCRQLRPRPPKFQPDQTEERLDLPSEERSSENNQRRKLRPRPSKTESIEIANRAGPARPVLQKRQELSARRSLKP